jgi:HSP20 family protein
MALIRWEPVRELNSLQHEMNRLFSAFFDTPGVGAGNGESGAITRWLPAMDLIETDDQFVLRADLPGLSEDDVKVELEDNVLTISGERKAEHEARKEGFYRLERAHGKFQRSLALPEGVDGENVSANFDHGVLEVRIPKPAERKPHRVSIGVGTSAPAIEGSEAPASAEGGEATAGGEGGETPASDESVHEGSEAPAGATSASTNGN